MWHALSRQNPTPSAYNVRIFMFLMKTSYKILENTFLGAGRLPSNHSTLIKVALLMKKLARVKKIVVKVNFKN